MAQKKIIAALLSAVFLLAGCSVSEETENSDSIQVHFINVGQGDCSLIVSDGYTVLIDAGESEESYVVTSYLSELGIEKLDFIIATHPHSDHIGGLAGVIENISADRVIVPHIPDDELPTTKTYRKFLEAVDSADCTLEEAYVGEVIELGISELEILAPVTDEYSDLNNFSIVSQLDYGGTSFLFTGDAESESEKDMMENNLLDDIDVLKVGHHGSDTSSKKKFLEVIKPDYAVISCGDNSYNHPNEKTVARLAEYTDKIYRTDHQGNIIFTSDGENISVEYSNPAF